MLWRWPKRLNLSGYPKNGDLRRHYLKTDWTKNNDIFQVPGHWRGLHNRQFFYFFSKFGQFILISKPAQLKCSASYVVYCLAIYTLCGASALQSVELQRSLGDAAIQDSALESAI